MPIAKTERFKLSIFSTSKIISPDQQENYISSQKSKPVCGLPRYKSYTQPGLKFLNSINTLPKSSCNNIVLCPLSKTTHRTTPLSTTTSCSFTLKVSCIASLFTQFYCWGVVVTHQTLHNVPWLLLLNAEI